MCIPEFGFVQSQISYEEQVSTHEVQLAFLSGTSSAPFVATIAVDLGTASK